MSIVSLPVLVVLAAGAGIVIVIVRVCKKRRAAKMARKHDIE